MAQAPVIVQEGPQRHPPIGCLYKEGCWSGTRKQPRAIGEHVLAADHGDRTRTLGLISGPSRSIVDTPPVVRPIAKEVEFAAMGTERCSTATCRWTEVPVSVAPRKFTGE